MRILVDARGVATLTPEQTAALKEVTALRGRGNVRAGEGL
jgi:hypothetical protein